MKVILRYLDSDDSKWIGVSYVVVMLFCMILQAVFTNLFVDQIFVLGEKSNLSRIQLRKLSVLRCDKALTWQCPPGMHVRMVVQAALYRKSLRLSTEARRDKTVGEIVNLMSNDSQTLRDVLHIMHMLWSSPAQIIAVTALIYIDMGLSVGAGVVFMVVLLPVSGFLASLQKKARVGCGDTPNHLFPRSDHLSSHSSDSDRWHK